jgi:outer membrane cobalamin receptor
MRMKLSAVCVAAGTLPTVNVPASMPSGLGLDVPSNTGSRLGLTPMETPASVSTLNADDIAERDLMRAQDVAIRQPGVSQSPEPGNGNTSLNARGFAGAHSVAQMVDGTRLVVAAGTITFPFSTAGCAQDQWRADPHGLAPRDLATSCPTTSRPSRCWPAPACTPAARMA